MDTDKARADKLQTSNAILGLLAALLGIAGTAYTVHIARNGPPQRPSEKYVYIGGLVEPGAGSSGLNPSIIVNPPVSKNANDPPVGLPPANAPTLPNSEVNGGPDGGNGPDGSTRRDEPDTELGSLSKLLNPVAVGNSPVSVAIRSKGVGMGGRPEVRLISGIEAKGVRLSRGFFRPAFLNSEYFQQFMAGDGGLLARSGALRDGSIAFVGELNHSFRKGEYNVTVCDLHFSYTVLEADGSARAQRSVSVSVPAHDRTTALNDAVSALLEEHSATIVTDLRS